MFITVDEFKKDPLKYISLIDTDNVLIMHEGKRVARLTTVQKSTIDTGNMSEEERREMVMSLLGMAARKGNLDTMPDKRSL